MYVTPRGIARYAYLTQPDEYKGAKAYKTDLIIDPEEFTGLLGDLQSDLDAFVAECKKENPKKYNSKTKAWTVKDLLHAVEDDQGEPTGEKFLRFKMNTEILTKKGTIWNPKPALYDAKKAPATVKYVGGGSIIRIKFEAKPYAMDSSKEFGLSLRPLSVQIIELQGGDGGADANGFDEEEGGFEASENFSDTGGFDNEEEETTSEDQGGSATDF